MVSDTAMPHSHSTKDVLGSPPVYFIGDAQTSDHGVDTETTDSGETLSIVEAASMVTSTSPGCPPKTSMLKTSPRVFAIATPPLVSGTPTSPASAASSPSSWCARKEDAVATTQCDEAAVAAPIDAPAAILKSANKVEAAKEARPVESDARGDADAETERGQAEERRAQAAADELRRLQEARAQNERCRTAKTGWAVQAASELERVDGGNRKSSVIHLSQMGDVRAVNALGPRLEDESWRVRRAAVQVLAPWWRPAAPLNGPCRRWLSS